ncbi:ABC transporter ATP-binding protein [Dongia sp.]|uniref:ABC transporter ATP-binding protein n=1 Tax=Dongia sp. TaxID=1977262 RepID=UPI00375122E6
MKNAFRIFFYKGWKRELLIIGIVLLTGAVEGIGIASLWPLLGQISGGTAETSHSMGNTIVVALDYLGLPQSVEVLLGVIAVISLLRFALTVTATNFIGRSVAQVATGLRLRLINAAVRARWSFFTTQPNARFTTAIGSDGTRAAQAYRSAGNVIAFSAKTLVYLGMAFWVSWQFFLAGIAVVALLWLAVSRFMKQARTAGRGKSKQTLALNKGITDALTNIKALKAMNRHGFIAQAFRRNVQALRDALEAETYSEAMVRAIQEPILILFLMGGIYAQHTLFGMSIQQILGSIMVLFLLSRAIGDVRSAMQRTMVESSAFWALTGLIEETEAEAEPVHGGKQPRMDQGIRIDAVTFGYGDKAILNDVAVEVPPHAVTTVIGSSGAGKTTIADVLVGLNRPDKGKVMVGDTDLEEIDTIAWRRQLGYIPQETVLFNDSIANNVTLGDETISQESVIAALKAADAWDFVQALPGGIDYVIGVRGSLLSGGQRQRLSIARALCNDPQFLILDEATSALDRETAVEIANGIRKLIGEKTILAITHQPIWVDAADRVYEMRAGVVKAAEPTVSRKPKSA